MFKRLRAKFGKATAASPLTLDTDNIPQHIAIIMDGNGRWAKSRGLPRIAGHHTGMKAV